MPGVSTPSGVNTAERKQVCAHARDSRGQSRRQAANRARKGGEQDLLLSMLGLWFLGCVTVSHVKTSFSETNKNREK